MSSSIVTLKRRNLASLIYYGVRQEDGDPLYGPLGHKEIVPSLRYLLFYYLGSAIYLEQ